MNREEYYNNPKNIANLVSVMKNREVIFMKRLENNYCIRGCLVLHSEALKYWIKTLDITKEDFNIYVSCAKYDYIKPNNKRWLFNEGKKHIINYDIMIDIDKNNGEYKNMLKTISVIVDTLQKYRVAYRINFSGNNYHLILKNCNFLLKWNDIKKLVSKFRKKFGTEFININGSGVRSSSFRKCEYSLNDDRLVYPLNSWQILNITTANISYTENKLYFMNDIDSITNELNLKTFLKVVKQW